MQCTAKKKDGTPSGCGQEKVITTPGETKAENKCMVIDDLRCQAFKADGDRCGGNRIKGSRFCYMHDPDPAIEKKRKRAREAGGRHSHRKNYKTALKETDQDIQLRAPIDACNLLEMTANMFLRGQIDVEQSKEMRQTVETFVKYWESIGAPEFAKEGGQENVEDVDVDTLIARIKAKRKIIADDLKVLFGEKEEYAEILESH